MKTNIDRRKLSRIVNRHIKAFSLNEMAMYSLRYSALRKLNPRQFAELHKRNMAGERFDDMVDALVSNEP